MNLPHERSAWNGARFDPQSDLGHYESYFQRANHPGRPLAFWIRYTVFSPRGRPQDTIGQLWAIYFDGEAGKIAAVKQDFLLQECKFSSQGLAVRIGAAQLDDASLQGAASSKGQSIGWALDYAGDQPPVLLLPRSSYARGFPRAKALVGLPLAKYNGRLEVNGATIPVEDWVGSQNHNWGSRHTDTYAWGQVVGFDNAPEAFLECATARLKLGPLWTPAMTVVCLRFDGHDYRLNSPRQMFRAKGGWKDFDWQFDSAQAGVRIRGRMHAAPEQFVSLTYYNPPGSTHTCLNSKLAACEVTLERAGKPPVTLTTRHRAAFEILT